MTLGTGPDGTQNTLDRTASGIPVPLQPSASAMAWPSSTTDAIGSDRDAGKVKRGRLRGDVDVQTEGVEE